MHWLMCFVMKLELITTITADWIIITINIDICILILTCTALCLIQELLLFF